jgi:hypothetical protein
MTTLAAFPRAAAIEALRPRLWNFLRGAAAEHEVGTYAEALWGLPAGQFDELVATHIGLMDQTERMLSGVEGVLPRLPSSVRRFEQELVGYVHGPVDWPKTQLRRVATADPTLFVCRPPERRYDTPPARLCHAALRACASLSALSGLTDRGIAGARVTLRSNHARLLLRHPKLGGLRGSQPPRPQAIQRLLRRWPELTPAAEFLRTVDASFRRRDPDALRAVLEERLLAPAADDDLFELLVAFDLIDALREVHSCVDAGPPQLVGDARKRVPLARLHSPKLGTVVVWWDRALWLASGIPSSSGALWPILDAARMGQQPFRPDVVLNFVDRGRVIPFEVKVTTKQGTVADERGAIQETLAYLHDAKALVAGTPYPHAVVVAWNATGSPPLPGRVAEVIVGDQEQVGDLLHRIVESMSP